MSNNKMIKVIIKEPGKAPYYDTIPDELRILQQYVDGNIETVTLGDTVIVCDNEGRLKGKPMNCSLADIAFCGTVIIAGVDGEDFADAPETLPSLDELFRVRCCPRCNSWYDAEPALSSADNKTEICPQCGQAEAMAEYARHKREAQNG
ncbi:MAG: DUF3846 domain-containing protein [Clostridia bacterium]|nr:DUF3846 domain-containing protein [Clostridia bacterium]